MSTIKERLAQDMAAVMASGNSDAIAEFMFQRMCHDELFELMKVGRNQEAIEEAGRRINKLEDFLGRNPELTAAFGETLSSFYSIRGMAYTDLGNQNSDTAMKKLALRDTERSLGITRLPPEMQESLERHAAALRAEIAEEEKKQKCFIATAAYGDALAPDVVILRHLRDRRLKQNHFGRWIIRIYERYSPPLADAIAPHPTARLFVRRFILAPIVWFVRRWTSERRKF